MLSKRNRVIKKEVDLIFKSGKSISSLNFNFKFIKIPKNPLNEWKISFIVPKSVAKLAVQRNLLRRRGYSVLKKINSSPSGIVGVFVFKKYQDDVILIENEIKNIFSKIY